MRKSPVRFGIICTSLVFPAWQARTIRNLTDHAEIELCLLIVQHSENAGSELNRRSGIKKSRLHNCLWSLYNDYYLKSRSKAHRIEDLSKLLNDVSRIRSTYIENGSQTMSLQRVNAIRNHQLDFILHFGRGSVSDQILDSTRYGVWAFQHNDEKEFQGYAPCFWEIYQAELLTESVLQRLTKGSDGAIILKRGFFKTETSHVKNIEQVFFESARWPAQTCIDIMNGHLQHLEGRPSAIKSFKCSPPSNLELIFFFFKILELNTKKIIKSLFYTDYWNIGVAHKPIQYFLDGSAPKPAIEWFPQFNKSKFIADPFAIISEGGMHIIYEEFIFKKGIGTIGSTEFTKDGFSGETIQIEEPFHLSYPFTFRHNNEIYSIPESYQARQVRLYRALDFPNKWIFERTLIEDYAGLDSTLFWHDEYWWMFSTDREDGAHHNLKIHFADKLHGKWYPHPKNPVKTDIRSARPAGSVFRLGESIFRPSMDYSEKVEGRIVINEIIKLSTTDFWEQTHCVVNPFHNTFYCDKVHTLAAAGDYTIVDGAKELFVFSNIHALRYKLKKTRHKISKRLRPG